MNTRLVITLLVVGACTAVARSPLTHAESAQRPDSLVASAHHGREPEVRVDTRLGVRVDSQAVRFAFDVANTGKKRVELAFPSGQAYDFVVLDSIGREVWRWGAHRMFTQALQTKLLGSGDEMRVAETLDSKMPPGRYVAVATLRSSNFPAVERVPFVVQ